MIPGRLNIELGAWVSELAQALRRIIVSAAGFGKAIGMGEVQTAFYQIVRLVEIL